MVIKHFLMKRPINDEKFSIRAIKSRNLKVLFCVASDLFGEKRTFKRIFKTFHKTT